MNGINIIEQMSEKEFRVFKNHTILKNPNIIHVQAKGEQTGEIARAQKGILPKLLSKCSEAKSG